MSTSCFKEEKLLEQGFKPPSQFKQNIKTKHPTISHNDDSHEDSLSFNNWPTHLHGQELEKYIDSQTSPQPTGFLKMFDLD
jgi:hypothetical protein